MTQQEQPSLTFEQALTRLRETVQELEQGDVSLEQATALFERGIGLAKLCNELLNAAELQVTRLQREFGDQLQLLQQNAPPRRVEEEAAEYDAPLDPPAPGDDRWR